MTKIREEITEITTRACGEGGSYYHNGKWVEKDTANDELEKLFRSWALGISQTLGQSTEGREDKSIEWNDGYITALFDVDAMIEEDK